MARYIMVDEASRKIINAIEWDGESTWSVVAGFLVLENSNAPFYDIGGTLLEDLTYTPPVPPEVTP